MKTQTDKNKTQQPGTTFDTRIGPLEFTHGFANGYPTDETVEKLYDERDFSTRLPGIYLVASGRLFHSVAVRHHEAVRSQERTDRRDPVSRGQARHPDSQCDNTLLPRVRRSLRRAADHGNAAARCARRDQRRLATHYSGH